MYNCEIMKQPRDNACCSFSSDTHCFCLPFYGVQTAYAADLLNKFSVYINHFNLIKPITIGGKPVDVY